MKRVYPNKDMCIGCRLCELACMTEHSQSKDLIIAFREERRHGLTPRRNVIHDNVVTVGLSCRHCDEPHCVRSCISGALYKDPETGRVVYEEAKCVGCWSCVAACPSGAVSRHPFKDRIVKCDLCPDRDIPACVAACPNMALVLVQE